MEPKTLQDAILYFANPANCREWIVSRRWPDGVECPRCGSKKVTFLEKYNRWQCSARHPNRQFTVKTGTIFEDSPLSLDKWLAAMWQVVNDRNGISSWELHRAIGVSQKTAWFMDHRIRHALSLGTVEKMGEDGGPVEADEAFIGGEPKNRHASKRTPKHIKDESGFAVPNPEYRSESGRGTLKTPVFGLLDRETRKVRAKVIPNVNREVLQNEILNNVSQGSRVHTDEHRAYCDLETLNFVHETVNHVKEYVRGDVHTNGLENFWSLLKRGLRGTYVAVEPFHLSRYIDEQVFRYNNRKLTDAERFDRAVRQIVGKRITWDQLTGKVGEMEPEQF